MFNINFSYCSLSSLFLFPSHGRYWKKDYLLHLAAAFNTAILALPSSVSFFFFWLDDSKEFRLFLGVDPSGLLVSLSCLPQKSSQWFVSPKMHPKRGNVFLAGALPAGEGLPRDPQPPLLFVSWWGFLFCFFHSRLRGWFVLSWWSIITSKTRYKK